jgi:RHS repeat-associated protein
MSQYGTHSYYHADGNGNVTMLISSSQMIAAKYLYDPYGNTLAKCGLLVDLNKYRFSSKEWNENSEMYYYLYRFYDPNLQRWLNRDPIGERGGINLFEYADNTPMNTIDSLGLFGGAGYGNPVEPPFFPPPYVPPPPPPPPVDPVTGAFGPHPTPAPNCSCTAEEASACLKTVSALALAIANFKANCYPKSGQADPDKCKIAAAALGTAAILAGATCEKCMSQYTPPPVNYNPYGPIPF